MQVTQTLYSNGLTIPDSAIERLARFLLPRMQAFLESEHEKQSAANADTFDEKAATGENPKAA